MQTFSSPSDSNLSQTTPTEPSSPEVELRSKAQPVPNHLTWLTITAVAILLAGVGGYMFAQSQSPSEVSQKMEATAPSMLPGSSNSPEQPNDQVVAEPQTPVVPADWKKQNMPTVGLSFSIPPRVAKLGDIQEVLLSQNNEGSIICGQFIKPVSFTLVQKVQAGDHSDEGCVTIQNPYLRLAATSNDFGFGRETGFTDLNGYKQVGDTYVATLNEFEFPLGDFKLTEITNANNVSVLKIQGQGIDPDNEGPNLRTELDKGTAIIIKGPASTYPGLSMVFAEGGMSEEEIDTLIQSVEKM